MRKSHVSLLLIFFLQSFITIAQSDSLKTQTDSLLIPTDSLIIQTSNGLEKTIDSLISNAINQKAFPGCVVYAARQDSTIFFKSYGHHTYDSIREVKKEDIYDLASVTKVVGATLSLMKLYDDGLIDLDKTIGDYVDGLGRKVGEVTIREALAHQGGLYPWIPYHMEIRKKNGAFKNKTISNTQSDEYSFELTPGLYLHRDFYGKIKKMIKKSKVAKDPNYRYSGLFFYLIPEMVQSLTGISYDKYLNDNFFTPLGAKTLGFNPLARFKLTQIVPTEIDSFFRMEPIHGKVHDEGAILMKGVSGNAGLFSNAEDLAKVFKMLLSEGQVDTLNLLKPQTIDLFTTAHFPNENNRRGLGFDKPLLVYDSIRSSVAKDASYRSYGHTGYTGTLVWTDPENDLVFIFLANRVYPSRLQRAIYELNLRPTIHQLLYDYSKMKKNKNEPPVELAK